MSIKNHKKIIWIAISVIFILMVSFITIYVIRKVNVNIEKTKVDDIVADSCPSGFIAVPGDKEYNTKDFCVMKYEAKSLNGIAVSVSNDKPWTDVSQGMAMNLSKNSCNGCHLITEDEWLTIAKNLLSVSSNWSSSKVGNGYIYSGHSNNKPTGLLEASLDDNYGYIGVENSGPDSQRRTLKLTNGQVIWDFSGNASEWTSGTATGGQPGSVLDESNYTWKEWSGISIIGKLNTKPTPNYDTLATSYFDSQHGIGKLYSNAKEDQLRAFIRGGSYTSGDSGGILSLDLSHIPDYHEAMIGFRVAK